MAKTSTQSGIGHVLVVALVVVVFAAVGFIGYSLYAKPAKTADTATTATSSAPTELTAPDVNSTSDLDKADAVLGQVDPSSSSASDDSTLGTQLNAF